MSREEVPPRAVHTYEKITDNITKRRAAFSGHDLMSTVRLTNLIFVYFLSKKVTGAEVESGIQKLGISVKMSRNGTVLRRTHRF